MSLDDRTALLEFNSQNQYCRTCSAIGTGVISLFSGSENSQQLCDFIHKYLPIKISEDDLLPTQLCKGCADTLIAWDKLRNGVIKAQDHLTEIFSSIRKSDDNVFEGDANTVATDSDDEPLIRKLTPTKKKRSRRKKIEAEPRSTETLNIDSVKNVKGKMMCFICLRRISSVESHFKTFTMCGNNEVIHCIICGSKIDGIVGLNQHLHSHLELNYSAATSFCQVCQLDLGETTNLVSHLLVHLEKSLSIHCVTCGHNMLRATLKRHIITHSGEKRFTCHHCGNRFAQVCGLIRHVKVSHEGVKSYKCPVCSKVLQSNDALRKHQDQHEDSRPFQCHSCGRTFLSRKHLYHHCKYHHSENGLRVPCNSCDRIFSSASVLRRHEKAVHLRLKEFQCQICSAQLSTKQYLSEHMRIHTNERPEVCPICGKTFQMSGNLRQHMKIHQERAQVCDICEKRFARRCQLLIHMGSHRGIPHPQCSLCGQTFVLKADLQKHMSSSHVDSDNNYGLLEACSNETFPSITNEKV